MIPKDSVKWFEKQFLSTSHSFVHISHCVCVCVLYACVHFVYAYVEAERWLSLLLSTLNF